MSNRMDNVNNINNGNSVIEIYERLGSIEAKLDDIRSIRDMAHDADKRSDKALARATANELHIKRIENNFKWAFGIMATVVTPLAIVVLNFMILN